MLEVGFVAYVSNIRPISDSKAKGNGKGEGSYIFIVSVTDCNSMVLVGYCLEDLSKKEACYISSE